MRIIIALLCFFTISNLSAQADFWTTVNENQISLTPESERRTIPQAYQTLGLELSELKSFLQDAPMQHTEAARTHPLIIDLPMPDGSMETFKIYESPVMTPVLAAKFPQIKSYAGTGVRDQNLKVKFAYSERGFDAIISKGREVMVICPYANNQEEYYISYFAKDSPTDQSKVCGNDHEHQIEDPLSGLEFNEEILQHQALASARSTTSEPVPIYEYKIAWAAAAEWTANQGGTVAGAMSSINTALMTLNSVYEREMAIRFTLVDNNEDIIFTDALTDPYEDVSNAGGMLGQNQQVLDAAIGTENYDIGHVMTIGCTNGIAGIAGGVVCSSNGKGRGVTCNGGGNLVNAILEIATHEVGHQFTASHTWDNCPGILDQRSGSTAFEPGSGSTIMSYSGSCGDQNVTFNSSPYYFHVGSLDQMYTYSRVAGGNSCPDLIETGNNSPDLQLPYGNGFYIPISTPFQLTAIASDPDGDLLTYNWEQYNTGPLSNLGNPVGNAPSFRSFPATEDPTRTFPRMQSVITNSSSEVEVLPTYSRNLKFRCTVRDNNPEIGGVVWDELFFEATDQAGPFKVTDPNGLSVIWEVGDYVEVTWDVANTDLAPVNCQTVNIKLSTDGGYTYPISLVEGVPNAGSWFVTVPDAVSSNVRVKVEAADNIFFDISNANFQIVPASEPGFAMNLSPYSQRICVPDPAIFELETISLLDYDSLIDFTVTGLPTGAVPIFSSNPALPSEGSTLTVETENVVDEGVFEIEVTAIATGGDTIVRNAFFEIVVSDFGEFMPLEPVNGASGVSELPTFTWDPSPNANTYEIEIATSPAFGTTVVDTKSGIIGSIYTPSILLEKNTLYFWRVKPSNECGDGVYSEVMAFHTETLVCSNFVSTNVPINISSVGTPTVESTITIANSGLINDLNVTQVKGNHDAVSHLDVSLISPEGTEVVLFAGECLTTSTFNLGLDDEAPFEIICPPINGVAYKPEGMLSDFDEEDPAGTWTLRVTVNDGAGSGGTLQDWGLEYCSSVSGSAPFLVVNETMPVPPGQGRKITDEFLLSMDDNNGPEELTYTLVTIPENGALFFLNNQLEIGQTFRQATINAGNLKYVHNGGPEVTDGFTFAVTDGEGGWFGTPKFNIEIDENVIVGTEDFEKTNDMFLFPNPARNLLNVRFKNPVDGKLNLSISNVQGQTVQSLIFENANQQLQLNTSELAGGIYFVQIRTGEQIFTEKVVIQR